MLNQYMMQRLNRRAVKNSARTFPSSCQESVVVLRGPSMILVLHGDPQVSTLCRQREVTRFLWRVALGGSSHSQSWPFTFQSQPHHCCGAFT